MAHSQQIEFCLKMKKLHPDFFNRVRVLDVGSGDINGNNQFLFKDSCYLGVDVAPGKNVNLVCAGHELGLPASSFDVIISTECFEHDPYLNRTLERTYALLRPGGLYLFTCATTGRQEHGTLTRLPGDSLAASSGLPAFENFYCNVTQDMIRKVWSPLDRHFASWTFGGNHTTCDLYFCGIKVDNTFALNDLKATLYRGEKVRA